MRSFALASGSSGNCFYIESLKGVKILVDLGLSFRKIKEILDSRGIDVNSIDYVFITHEHADHCTGLKKFCESVDVKVFLSKGTYDSVCDVIKNYEILKEYQVVELDDLRVFGVSKSHDSNEAFSYLFENGKKLAIFTDIGFVSDKIIHILKDVDILYFEASYCDEIVKQRDLRYNYVNRLLSDRGHLSVNDAGEVLSKICRDEQIVVLSHISKNANTYENAYLKVKKCLSNKGLFPQINISFQDEPTSWIE
jgi:phosphoribosyl 1,2-cyclic phosphodiesterase